MRATLLAVVSVAGCHNSRPATAVHRRPDPCDLVEAMLAIDSPGYQNIYASCGRDSVGAHVCADRQPACQRQSTAIVDVRAPASLLPPTTTCHGRSFSLYRGEENVDWMIVRLDVFAVEGAWRFVASSYQPNPRATPDGGLDVTDAYCSAVGGFVEWSGDRWQTFVDVERALRSQPNER